MIIALFVLYALMVLGLYFLVKDETNVDVDTVQNKSGYKKPEIKVEELLTAYREYNSKEHEK